MIRSFKNKGTEDIFDSENSKAARKVCPQHLWRIANLKLDTLNFAQSIDDLRVPVGNRLERLRGSREGQFSIRINRQYRICFIWTETGPIEVEITDYH